MEAGLHLSPTRRDWKDLYTAAIFEDDKAKILRRIAEAETAVAARAGELIGEDGNQVREQKAMENAIYFLRLLRRIEAKANTSSEPAAWTAVSAQ
jgi:hypothetical protein